MEHRVAVCTALELIAIGLLRNLPPARVAGGRSPAVRRMRAGEARAFFVL